MWERNQLLYCHLHFFYTLQYKFIVDGEWRHDEHQPFVTGSYGIVNTVVLAREPDYIPTVLTPQMTCGSSMDVDNEAFQRVVLNLLLSYCFQIVSEVFVSAFIFFLINCNIFHM